MIREHRVLGKWSDSDLDNLIRRGSQIEQIGERIDFLSKHFLHTDYRESTLIGNTTTEEVLVINLEGVDCFTFIDYIEAMRRSDSVHTFKENLIHVRYNGGKVSFDSRNHFFTDWCIRNKRFVMDVTEDIGVYRTVSVKKTLNKKKDGTPFIAGLEPVERIIHYIPSRDVDIFILGKLKSGDYVGIYTQQEGLDVSHVGIIIKQDNSFYLRHASSLPDYRKVIDQNFPGYIKDKEGIVVVRPKQSAYGTQ